MSAYLKCPVLVGAVAGVLVGWAGPMGVMIVWSWLGHRLGAGESSLIGLPGIVAAYVADAPLLVLALLGFELSITPPIAGALSFLWWLLVGALAGLPGRAVCAVHAGKVSLQKGPGLATKVDRHARNDDR